MDNKETANRLKALIASNQHGEAIEEMLKLLESTGGDGEDGLFVLLGRKNRLDEQIARHTISKENADLEFNRITETLLSYADKIGQGERVTFAASSLSKAIFEHDKENFQRIDKFGGFDLIRVTTDHLYGLQLLYANEFDQIVKLEECLESPDSYFFDNSIKDKSQSLAKAIWNVLDFVFKNFKKHRRIEGEEYDVLYSLEEDTLRYLADANYRDQHNKLNESLFDLCDKLKTAYKDFRIEIKHKFFI